jgi:hypothetical protein
MPLPNRVDPFGNLFATPARGTLMGNRGGKFHADDRKLTTRRFASRQWICCVLDFKGRQRDVWGRYYTELFFLDEVTALAAGHRPCFECRRKDAEHFSRLFSRGRPKSAHSRESGNPALCPRFRGDERRKVFHADAKTMDILLHAERLDGKGKRTHRRKMETLPDGAMIALDGDAYAVRGKRLLRWTPRGYKDSKARPREAIVDVLTPPSILKVLKAGYAPQWHRSAAP